MTAATSPADHAALLVVDVQNDFCTGGALAVPESDRVVASLNRYIDDALAHGLAVYASRDWHPVITNHFTPYGGAWPVHCVQGTDGARFHPDLNLPPSVTIVSKGEQPDSDGYSAFEGRTPRGALLYTDLRERGITRLYVGGLATDYCVKHSVLDALAAGMHVSVLEDAISGVDAHPDDSARALAEMREKGADLVRLAGSLPG